jgi:hypothetical protein
MTNAVERKLIRLALFALRPMGPSRPRRALRRRLLTA